MATPLSKKFGIADLRAVRRGGEKVPMLTCYDFTTARLMHEAGVPALLVGDSAANVVLGHPTYYPRFGFAPASRLGLRCVYDVPDEVFMATELTPGALDHQRGGLVKYHPAFDAV